MLSPVCPSPFAALVGVVLAVVLATPPAGAQRPKPVGAANRPDDFGVTKKNGSDQSPLPKRYPTGNWLPIKGPLLSLSLRVDVFVNGKKAVAYLDTGAQTTVMSNPVADSLGLLSGADADTVRARVIDAHGKVLEAKRVRAKTIRVGRRTFDNVKVTVAGDRENMFLIGLDLLQHVDLFIAGDQGLVGIFRPGEAPENPIEAVLDTSFRHRQMVVQASTPNARGDLVTFHLIVDTGASTTSVPVREGLKKGLKAEVGFKSHLVAVSGGQEFRGRFVLDPIVLGSAKQVKAGRVLALGSVMGKGRGLGLLGLDVLMRHHTIISPSRAQIRFRPSPQPPPSRKRGPKGVCKKSKSKTCAAVSLKVVEKGSLGFKATSMDDLCLQIDVDRSFAGKTLEMAVSAYDDTGRDLFSGGALRIFTSVPKRGAHKCFGLWTYLSRLDLDAKSRLSLRFLRTENVDWPCDPAAIDCLSFSGPHGTPP